MPSPQKCSVSLKLNAISSRLFQGGGFMDTIKDAEKAVEKEFNKDVDLVKDATGMDTW